MLKLAKETLLSVEDVKFWTEHLNIITKINRKKGAEKAAKT